MKRSKGLKYIILLVPSCGYVCGVVCGRDTRLCLSCLVLSCASAPLLQSSLRERKRVSQLRRPAVSVAGSVALSIFGVVEWQGTLGRVLRYGDGPWNHVLSSF